MNSRRSQFKVGWLAILAVVGACFTGFTQGNDRANSDDFSTFRVISDRNIFDPNRRPRVASGPAPTVVDSFSLAGTMDYAKGKFAVFDGTSSDYHKVLESGGRIAGYTVTEIGRDMVKLSAGTNTLELRVGTQMRRDDNGHWSAGESAESPSYAANSSRGDSGRRRYNMDSRRAGPRTGSAPAVAAQSSSTPEPDNAGTGSGSAPAAAPGGADANDPVARMMARRMQETSGNENGNGNDNRNSNQ
jgi:hypothetical protein